MKKGLWIGLAGAVGAITRVSLGQIHFGATAFPFVTLSINILGSYLLCLIFSGFRGNQIVKDAITIGFLGSFTTFSALSMETVQLMENGQLFLAVLYIGSSILGGIVAGAIGFHMGKKKVNA